VQNAATTSATPATYQFDRNPLYLTDQERKELEADLANLTPKERELLEDVLRDAPGLTPLEALHQLRWAGM
jgi:hypothetical protein